MKPYLLALASFLLLACGDQALVDQGQPTEKKNLGMKIRSFDTSYGDGYTWGPSFGHDLHYDRDSGNVVIKKEAYMIDPNYIYLTISGEKKREVDRALDSIDTSKIKDVYLTDDIFPASQGDGLSMAVVLSDGKNVRNIDIDTFYPERLPPGLYFLFKTSLYEGRWYREQ